MSRARGTEPGVDLSSRLDRDRTPYIAVLIIIVNELRSGIIIIVKELSVLLHPKLLVILIFRFLDFIMQLTEHMKINKSGSNLHVTSIGNMNFKFY